MLKKKNRYHKSQQKRNDKPKLKTETIEEQVSVASQYGNAEANKGEKLKSNSNPQVSSTRTNKKTQIINIGDQRIEVINPEYVTELERRLDEMDKKIRQVENNNRRIHNHTNTLTNEINSVKSSIPRWG